MKKNRKDNPYEWAKIEHKKIFKRYANEKVILRGKEIMVVKNKEILTIGKGFCMSEERVKKTLTN